jgi:hypothetical protein
MCLQHITYPSTFSSLVDLSKILYLERGEVDVIEPKKKCEGKNIKGNNKRYLGDDQGGRYQKKRRIEGIFECK